MNITYFQDDDGIGENDENISSFIPPFETLCKEIYIFHKQLQIALEEGVRLALDYFDKNKLPKDVFLLNQLIRYHTKRLMKEKADINLYEMDDLANNGLSGNYAGYHIRVFKGYHGNIPIPNSDAKVSWLSQQMELDLDLPAMIFVRKRPNIFFLWELDSNYSLMPLRLICPKSAQKGHDATETYYNEMVANPALDIQLDKQAQEIPEIGGLDIKKKDEEREKEPKNKDHKDGEQT